MKEAVFPQSLKKGDKIALISPAGAVEQPQLEKGIQLIEAQGYEPVLGKHLYTQYKFGFTYAGTENERIQELNWAFNNEEFSAVWASRGGYGCQHLLSQLQISEYIKKPKWYIGYSDNTVIQSFLLKNNFASIHGQTVKTSSFGVSEESYAGVFDILKGDRPKYTVTHQLFNRKGAAEGILVGGNLALIYALLGTEYSYDFKDKILFLEDIGEHYYALDRMLMSLDLAGVFRDISGLIIGGMTNMGDEKDNKCYAESFDELAYQVIAHRISNYDFPAAFGFPNGHIYDNRPLIIGANLKMIVAENAVIEF